MAWPRRQLFPGSKGELVQSALAGRQPLDSGGFTAVQYCATLKNGSTLPAMTDALAKEYGTVANELT